MTIKSTLLLFSFFTLFILSGCKAFMHGYTQSKPLNSYSLITGDKHSFGDKRIEYVKGFHKHSQFSEFLNLKGNPSFFYEYKTNMKYRGIRLYYIPIDSVFTFEEPKKGKLNAVLKACRKIEDYEKETFNRLRTGQ